MLRLLILFLLFFAASCDSEPVFNYDDETIVKVLKDMLIAEGAATRIANDQRDSLTRFYYDQIYQIHGIDSMKFTNDLRLLGESPAHSTEIYSRVEKELEQDQIGAKKKNDK